MGWVLLAALIPAITISVPAGGAWPILFIYPFCFEHAWRRIPKTLPRLGLMGTMGICGFHWIYFWATSPFGGMPPWVGVVAAILGSMLCVYPMMLLSFVRSPRLATALIPFVYFLPMIFPWSLGGSVGYPLDQWASIVGMPGLNFLIFLPWLVTIIAPRLPKVWPAATLAGALITGGGVIDRYIYPPLPSGDSRHLLLVQPSVENESKLAAESGAPLPAQRVIEMLRQTTLKGLEKHPQADLVIWPETSYPFPYQEGRHPSDAHLQRILDEIKRPLLFGGYQLATRSNSDGSSGATWIAPSGKSLFFQSKHVLVIFGEYLPGYLDWLRKIFPVFAQFESGPPPKVRQTPLGPMLFSVCYEGIHPGIFSETPQGITHINLTNDSWYGHTVQRWQHLNLTRIRAIEHRHYLLRVTNDGISAIILPNGQIEQHTRLGTREAILATIPQTNAPNTYTLWSTFIGWLSKTF